MDRGGTLGRITKPLTLKRVQKLYEEYCEESPGGFHVHRLVHRKRVRRRCKHDGRDSGSGGRGFGNAKGVAREKVAVLPSVVAIPAGDLGLAGIGMKTARRATRVTFDRGDFFVGPAARAWGRVVENLDFSRLGSPEAEALFYALIAGLIPDGAAVRLVLGLPVPLLRDEAVARPLLEAL